MGVTASSVVLAVYRRCLDAAQRWLLLAFPITLIELQGYSPSAGARGEARGPGPPQEKLSLLAGCDHGFS